MHAPKKGSISQWIYYKAMQAPDIQFVLRNFYKIQILGHSQILTSSSGSHFPRLTGPEIRSPPPPSTFTVCHIPS